MRYLYKIILLYALATSPLLAVSPEKPASLFSSLKRRIGDLVCFLITSDEVSEETTAYARDLMRKIDPHQTITCVQKFNSVGEYLFGRNNAIALPFLNYVMLNTKTLMKMPEETQRFVIGRSLYTLAHPKAHFSYKMLLPALYNLFFQIHDSPMVENAITHFTPESLLHTSFDYLQNPQNPSRLHETRHAVSIAGRNLLYHALAALHIAYASRFIEREADSETAKILNCVKGGIEFFRTYQNFNNDGTIIGSTSSLIPFFELANWGSFSLLTKVMTVGQPAMTLNGITLARLRGQSIISQIKDLMPGQLVPYSNWLEHTYWKLPIIKYFSHSASSQDRIASLAKLHTPTLRTPVLMGKKRYKFRSHSRKTL